MKAPIIKEIKSFFGLPIGYLSSRYFWFSTDYFWVLKGLQYSEYWFCIWPFFILALDFDFPDSCHNYAQLCDEKAGNTGVTFNKTLSCGRLSTENFLVRNYLLYGYYSNIHLCRSNSNLGMPGEI
jgi:hypothetical protein